jgi:hypothetical protein
MNGQSGFATLADDQGTPVRWKVGTLLAVVALAISLVLQVARAGAKSEKLETLAQDVKELKAQAAAFIAYGVRQEDIIRRQDAMDKKLDQLLERRGR